MSLYNMVNGRNPYGPLLIGILGYHPENFGRIRDVFIDGLGPTENPLRIAVLTRCGGNNRREYAEMFSVMSSNPYYLCDADDEFDSTYATIYFSVPNHFKEIVGVLKDTTPETPVWDNFAKFIETMKSDPSIRDEEELHMEQLGALEGLVVSIKDAVQERAAKHKELQ